MGFRPFAAQRRKLTEEINLHVDKMPALSKHHRRRIARSQEEQEPTVVGSQTMVTAWSPLNVLSSSRVPDRILKQTSLLAIATAVGVLVRLTFASAAPDSLGFAHPPPEQSLHANSSATPGPTQDSSFANLSQVSATIGGARSDVYDQSSDPAASASPSSLPSDIGSLREYIEGVPVSPLSPTEAKNLDLLGIEVKDGANWLAGRNVWGAEVLNVRPLSPCAIAGIESRRATIGIALKTVTFVGALVIPFAGIGYQFISDRGIGDRHDLIIGVDGTRIHDVDELNVALLRMHAGDVIYLNILRAAERFQIPVSLQTAGSK
jgi:S1-C subfamily serine protease